MKVLVAALLAAFFTVASCTREKAPEPVPKQTAPSKKAVPTAGQKTLFEKSEQRRRCESNPAECDGETIEMDITKSVEKELEPQNEVTTEFCLGGCSKKSIVNWSLEWK